VEFFHIHCFYDDLNEIKAQMYGNLDINQR
jgi:hypothetical protein